jgi:hypothetical protein
MGRVDTIEPFLTAATVAAPVRIGGGMRRKVLEAMALGRPVVTTHAAHGRLRDARPDLEQRAPRRYVR